MKTILVISLFVLYASAQVFPIPNQPAGIQFGKRSANFTLTAYYDLLCPDSRQSYYDLNQVFDQNGGWDQDKVQYNIQIFALPYHINAFYFLQLFRFMVDTQGHDGGHHWIDFSFKNQEAFYTAATQNMTNLEIMNALSIAAANATDLAKFNYTANDYLNALNNSTYNLQGRTQWKLCAVAGVSGTPTFTGNQVGIVGSSSWDGKQWNQFLAQYYNSTSILSKNENKFLDIVKL